MLVKQTINLFLQMRLKTILNESLTSILGNFWLYFVSILCI